MLLEITDMVTQEKCTVTHMVCFIPEKINIPLNIPMENGIIKFGYVPENGSKLQPIIIDNRYIFKVTTKLDIPQVKHNF